MRRAFFLFCLISLLSLQLPAQFAAPVTYPVQGSWGIAAADFNRDGKLDLAVAGGSSVSILLGNGDGTFQPYVAYPTGGAMSVIAADFNGDGIPDLAVATGGANVSILLGNGDGTFRPYVSYPAGNTDEYLVAADFNGDGKIDLAVADSGATCQNGSVSILLGNGDGTFHPQTTFTDGMQCSYSIMAADFNHDGKVDLAMLNGGGSFGIYILLGKGDGTFQQPVWFGDVSTPHSGVISDFNGDGNLDLAVATWLGGNVAVLFGDGQGNFSSPVFYGTGYLDAQVVAGDFNMDEKLDLVASDFMSSSISVLVGNGDGTFETAADYAVPMGAWNIAVGDFNGDGAPDLAVTTNNEDGGVVSILLNTIRATTTTLTAQPNPVAPHQLVTYDASVVSLSGKTVTGSVTFKDAGVPVATITLENHLAAWGTRYKSVGSHAMTATYSGDANNSGSKSPTWTEAVVGASKTVLTTSGAPSLVGQPVTFTATVTSQYVQVPDGGTVTFYDGSTLLGSATLANQTATCTTTVLRAGTLFIKAVYAGDATLAPSMGFVRQQVLKYATTTALTSAPNPSTYDQSVTFTATVTSAGPTPTGKVTFTDAGKALRSVALSAGAATFTTSKLGAGTHPITARYIGDADNTTSTSPILDQVVQ